jgi:DNA-binding response OmpR family regulator
MKKERSILILEDEIAIRRLLERVLSKHGYRLSLVSSLGEALEEIHRQNWDMLITDIRLPDGDGRSAIREFRPKFSAATVIVISGSVLPDEDPELMEEARIHTWFSKPFDPGVLEQTVLKALNKLPHS